MRTSSKVIKTYVIWLVYQQGKVFLKFKGKEKFVKMVKDFGVSKLTIALKISTVKLIDKYPKLKNSSLFKKMSENDKRNR